MNADTVDGFHATAFPKLNYSSNSFLGKLAIGTSFAPYYTLDVVGDGRISGCLYLSSTPYGTCSSDIRFKRSIVPFSPVLNRVAQLQPVHFYWRTDEFPDRHFGTSQSEGLIAQDVEKVMPELVANGDDGYKAVHYGELPLLLLQAIKELKAESDELKRTIDEQNARIRELEATAKKE